MKILTKMKSNKGATAIEYGLMSALVATAITGSVALTGVNVKAPLCTVADGISTGSCSGSSGSGSSSSSGSSSGSGSSSSGSGTSNSASSGSGTEGTDAYSGDADSADTTTASESYGSQFDLYDGMSAGSVATNISLDGTTGTVLENLLSQLNDDDAITDIHGLYYSGNNTTDKGDAITSLSDLNNVLNNPDFPGMLNGRLSIAYNPDISAPGESASRTYTQAGMANPLFQVKTASGSVYTVGYNSSSSASNIVAIDGTTGKIYTQTIVNPSAYNRIEIN